MTAPRHRRQHPPGRRPHLPLVLALLTTLCLTGGLVPPTAAAESFVPISGAGSTWSQNAVDQWRRNVSQYGLRVNYQGTGSSDGRNQFRNGTVDFAVSEIPYGLTDGGVVDAPPSRPYAYMPIVAGGTSFMYNLKISGKRVTNLRLSGEVLAKIFTGVVTTWNDPAIAADNPGLSLPARRVVPVVRSDGSGTTAQFTTWLSKEHTGLWDAYCQRAGRRTPCGLTSNYPVVPGTGFTAQSGSLGVSGYVAQEGNEGTINYVEYSYALTSGFPVAKLLNAAGYYVEPKASNVAVGLLAARIDENPSSPAYLTQDLSGVYRNADKRAYPLSSYSYLVLPTAANGNFGSTKGKSLGSFAYYFLCEGQQQAESLGYSPLPVNLVEAGLSQVRRIPGVAVQDIDISTCNNPTFSSSGENTLAAKAPQPPDCDRRGAAQCGTGTGGARAPTATSGSNPGGATPGGTSDVAPSGGGAATGPSGVPVGPDGAAVSVAAGTATLDPLTGALVPLTAGDGAGDAAGLAPVVDPDTGEVLAGAVPAGGLPANAALGSAAAGAVTSVPVTLAASGAGAVQSTLVVLCGLLLLAVACAPPLLARRLTRQEPA